MPARTEIVTPGNRLEVVEVRVPRQNRTLLGQVVVGDPDAPMIRGAGIRSRCQTRFGLSVAPLTRALPAATSRWSRPAASARDCAAESSPGRYAGASWSPCATIGPSGSTPMNACLCRHRTQAPSWLPLSAVVSRAAFSTGWDAGAVRSAIGGSPARWVQDSSLWSIPCLPPLMDTKIPCGNNRPRNRTLGCPAAPMCVATSSAGTRRASGVAQGEGSVTSSGQSAGAVVRLTWVAMALPAPSTLAVNSWNLKIPVTRSLDHQARPDAPARAWRGRPCAGRSARPGVAAGRPLDRSTR